MSNVIGGPDKFNRQGIKRNIVRIAPENDGIYMLYSSELDEDTICSLPIACWALLDDMSVIGMVIWIDSVVFVDKMSSNISIKFEGYSDPVTGEISFESPEYKKIELTSAYDFYKNDVIEEGYIQIIPDNTYAHSVHVIDNKPKLYRVTDIALDVDGIVDCIACLGVSCPIESVKYIEGFKFIANYNAVSDVIEGDEDAKDKLYYTLGLK